MPSLNKVILIGNLVADPELKTTSNGLSVTSFRIGVQRRFAKDSAQQQTDFINIVCWRQTAEFVTRYFRMRFVAVSQLYRQGRQPANSV